MTSVTDFAKMVPGFDFLQGLMKGAGAAIPGMSQWIAPTLDPDELERRISELRTVQFWLEQNARMLAATIQALEVQRMTLSTLKNMNMPVAGIADAFRMGAPSDAPKPAATAAPKAAAAPAAEARPKATPAAKDGAEAKPSAGAAALGLVDPMQWWGALTQQFTELAGKAMSDTAVRAAQDAAGSVVKQSLDVAGRTLKAAVGASVPGRTAARKRPAARKAAAKAKPGK